MADPDVSAHSNLSNRCPDKSKGKGQCRLSLALHRVHASVLLISLLSFSIFSTVQHDSLAAETMSAPQRMEQAAKSFRQGAIGQAALHWTEAARLYEREGNVKEQSHALIRLAEALQQMGQYRNAVVTLQTALGLAEKTGVRTRVATIYGRLGNAYFALGEEERALDLLYKGLAVARDEGKSALVAVLLNDSGNVLAAQERNTEAIGAYTESAILANATGQRELAVTALINRAMASLQDGLYANAKEQLDQASTQIQALEDSHNKAYGWLNIGLAYDDLRVSLSPARQMVALAKRGAVKGSRGIEVRPGEAPSPKGSPGESLEIPGPPKPATPLRVPDETLLRLAREALRAATKTAKTLGDSAAESYALGYLGQLSERERRYEEALDLTRQAVLAAQKVNVPESLYRWHWQTARLLKASGMEEDALAAYKRAVRILQPIRYEFSSGYHGRRNSFRESVGPLFFELADLLLTRASSTADPKQYDELLVQARDTTEAFKAAELQDYFRDECVKAARSHRKSIEVVGQSTVVVYPIMLPDRLELLVSMPTGLKRFAVPVGAETLTQEIRAFRVALQDRRSRDHISHAQQLYDWLIRPMEVDLTTLHIDTLVFVPDGALRTIPLAPLHDGKQYVIQKYAVAVTPGMELTDPRPINRADTRLLSLGLTDAVQGFPPLPNVATELNAVKAMYGGKILLNGQFRILKMEAEMKEQQYSIVHIASHGVLENEVQNSFLLAYDDKITMDRLSQLIGLAQFRESPLELLTLSACETAAGDDRAALGLAGVAIKAGARSALATLWFIDDAATSDLIAEFYNQLRNPSVSKAAALQRAQVKILNQPGREHPSFWSPFLLINNWL